MKILVTGGAGYIGSHITQFLLNAGFQVVVLDNLTTGFKEAVPLEAKFILADVRNTQLLKSLFIRENFDAVIHLAAKLIVPESVNTPAIYYDNNVNGTLSVVMACQSSAVNKLIFSSSAMVYGDSNSKDFSETDPVSPLNPYAQSKAMSEQMLIDCEKAFGIKSVRLRYFNVAGSDPNNQNGLRTKNSTHLFKAAAEAAIGKRNAFVQYGNNFETNDRSPIRDYIHVSDLAEIHLLALRFLELNERGVTFNCGYGKGHSVKEVVDSMKKVSGVNFPVEIVDRRPGDVTRLVANVDLLKKTLNWKPKYDNLELLCKTTLDWEKTL
jgi:UDP-glucose 4-epimerase